jgi:hypothetical protein
MAFGGSDPFAVDGYVPLFHLDHADFKHRRTCLRGFARTRETHYNRKRHDRDNYQKHTYLSIS